MINALLMSANQLKSTDIIFFVCCAVAVALAVAIYFLIPVINRKQYQEQRDNLAKREEAFKANKKAATIASDAQEGDNLSDGNNEAIQEVAEATNSDENTDGNN